MGQTKRNPSAGGAGARNVDHIGSLIASEINPSRASLQATCISRRLAIPYAMGATVIGMVEEQLP
jgi:hypothetical protein